MIIKPERSVCPAVLILPNESDTTTGKKACSNCLTVYTDELTVCPADGAVLTTLSIQVCYGLARAHSKGIVHRDIKPSNIVLVNEDGQSDFVRIVDFGIAKITRENELETGSLTRPGKVFGSPLYMSPEQWRGGQLDARTDIYSLGAVMYTTLSGSTLFGKSDDLQLAYKHSQNQLRKAW